MIYWDSKLMFLDYNKKPWYIKFEQDYTIADLNGIHWAIYAIQQDW